MKNFYTSVMIALMPAAGMAQIGVGTTSLDATAMLQVNASASTNAKGFLGPRVALTSTSANSPFSVTPATGLMVYNTATAGSGVNEVTPGYYSYTGTGWERLAAPPTTFVGGTTSGFNTAPESYIQFTTYARASLGNIALPPGRWEVIAEYTCIPDDNFILGDQDLKSRDNTYWLSNSNSYSGFAHFNYPLNLNGLSSGVPTSDALFSGAAISVQKVATWEGGTTIHYYPRQTMKFYINNATAGDKTYYLFYHESFARPISTTSDGVGMWYKPGSGENRLYAVRIN
jgi:hypothetical protein